MEPVVGGPAAGRRLIALCLGLAASWYVYVPIHELLHALGCAMTGGTVTTLQVQTQYGGAILAKVFPFVVAGGEYAGRLSDFDTHGSDWVYLATDAMPYTLSCAIGVPLLRACARRPRPLLLGLAIVVALAPFYNLPGDYYEMGSILVTRAASWLGGSYEGLRSDDLLLLVSQLAGEPESLGLAAGDLLVPWALVGLSLLAGVALAFATWGLGDVLATAWIGPLQPIRRAGPPADVESTADTDS